MHVKSYNMHEKNPTKLFLKTDVHFLLRRMINTHYNLKKITIKLVVFKILPGVIINSKGEIHRMTDRQKNGPRRNDTG